MSRGRTRALGSLVAIATAVVFALSGCASASDGSSGDVGSTAGQVATEAPEGVVDDAFQTGDGQIVVDLFTDASCPHCRDFDATAGDELRARAEAGEITLRIHPVNFVSARRGDDTDFSTRVMNLLAVASDHGQGDVVPAVYSAAIAEQAPTLDDPMPDDVRLIELAGSAGLQVDDGMRDEITGGTWNAWVQDVNDRTVGQPIGDTGEVLTGVPTLLVDGVRFAITEDGTDLARLQQTLDDAVG
ncbi:thioredoxin domain-containing protein [Agromyces intestinalis]|uniref:Thioredoxin domain-containing protein n=1 Tax=Agromyces intestinalis TaxID=2592652 RepID=A0A5C1YD49_9MICO|nr:thioredoxin domain-containing protein [Agromyces intestinalis]QEO14023.1 thioredoxin domain-containing protein [Agromyces intestinalis]